MPTREERMRHIPPSLQKIYEKSLTSKANAIKSFCIECTGYERKAVTTCKDTGCPLWPHRPYQKRESAAGAENVSSESGQEESE